MISGVLNANGRFTAAAAAPVLLNLLFIAAMAVASTIVDVSPFSTSGALVLANSQGVDKQVFYRQLLGYGALVTGLAPLLLWIIFVVIPA